MILWFYYCAYICMVKFNIYLFFLFFPSFVCAAENYFARKAFIFTHLRYLRLELLLYGNKKRKTDVLDFAYLLEVAPFMEKLELLVSLSHCISLKHILILNGFEYGTMPTIVNNKA